MKTLEAIRAERLKAKDYSGYLLTFDGHEAFLFFLEIVGQMPDADYWTCLAQVWRHIEVSHPHRFMWLSLFSSNRPQRHRLMSKSERKALTSMPEKLTVYRGYAKGTARSGLSWTLSEEVALRFAAYATGERRAFLCGHMANRPGMIVVGKCFKRNVLAYFNDRKEEEIVIHPGDVFSKRSREVKGAK